MASSPTNASTVLTADHGATGDRAGPKPSVSKKTAVVAKAKKTSSHAGEHPKYSAMVADAIAKLKERGGSSRQAILKYITANYKVGSEINKVNTRIKVALKSGVKSGALKQSKGTGASGSFRLGDKKGTEKTSKLGKMKKTKAGKSATKKPKTATRKPKSPAKKTAVKKAKSKSPAKKLKVSTKKIKTPPKAKPKNKSPKKTTKPKKPAKKTAKK